MLFGMKLKIKNNSLKNRISNLFKNKAILLIIAAIFYIISYAVSYYISFSNSPQKVQELLSKSIQSKEKTFTNLVHNKQLLEKLIIDSASTNAEKNKILEYPFGIYIYKHNHQQKELVFWNNNNYSISKSDLNKPDSTFLVQYQNGTFECINQTIILNNTPYTIAALIPIHWQYFIENKYLKNFFNDYPEVDNYYELTLVKNNYAVTNSKGTPIYYLNKKSDNKNTNTNFYSLLLQLCAIICLLFYLHFLSIHVLQKKGFKKSFLLLVVLLVSVRALSYLVNFPVNFNQLALFDPSVYASNIFHPSLGDLLINSIIIFWLVIFYKFNYSIYTNENNKNFNQLKLHKALPYLQIVAIVLITFLCVSTIKSLILDSKISFDVSNFFGLNWYSIIGFIVISLCIISYYHLTHILFISVTHQKITLIKQLVVLLLVGLIIIGISLKTTSVISNAITICWLIVYIIILNFRKKDLNIYLLKSSFFVFWILFFAISVATLLMLQNNYIEIEQRKKWAEELAEKIDPNSETLLKIATTNFSNEFLQQNFKRLNEEFSNKFIKDSLVNENFSGYLNKYDTRIYTYDSLLNPLFNDDSLPYSVIKSILLSQSKETSIPDLCSFEDDYKKENYIYEKNIKQDSVLLGYVFVVVKPKQYKSEAIYPELFKQVKDLSSDFNTHYAYAIYNNGTLVNSFNDYSFPYSLSKQKTSAAKFEIRKNSKFKELWYYNTSGKTVIIVKKSSAILEMITLFAYLFCTFLILIAALYLANFIFKTRLKKTELQQAFSFKIRTQIQATIIMVSLFSFIVIGATTISYFVYRFNQSSEDRLSKTISVMANQVEEKLKVTNTNLTFDDKVDITTLGFGNSLEKVINDVAEMYNSDINLYNNSGTLIASTQPYIFNKQLLSEKMNPIAYDALNKNKSTRYLQSEKIAGFKFLSIYVPINNADGNIYAFVNIPFLNSQTELNQEISSFLSTLMNLNAFIFLLAGAIAYMATDKITASFSLISNKMKAINFEQKNETIEWNRNDELGTLVKEYNKMVLKLEASAKALAKSEREGAWREMARQVAHEIKNPLTPMKLSIQYLQKSIDNNNTNIQELTNHVSKTLIEQIEQLSKIASDFSQFANIENTQPEIFELSDIISSLIDLYKLKENVHFIWNKSNDPFFINADKSQISRLFKNLISNAIEASKENEKVEIKITQVIFDTYFQISIQDNGVGIDEAMKPKIFTPNFTTKSSGTGLGLAICYGIVERANGKISFETKKNMGSTFTVSFPKA